MVRPDIPAGDNRAPHRNELPKHVDRALGFGKMPMHRVKDVDGSTIYVNVLRIPGADASIIVRRVNDRWRPEALYGDFGKPTGEKKADFTRRVRQLGTHASWRPTYSDEEIGTKLKWMAEDARRAHPAPDSRNSTQRRRL
jgi:hypothetical protein